jgi:hypothetical protein
MHRKIIERKYIDIKLKRIKKMIIETKNLHCRRIAANQAKHTILIVVPPCDASNDMTVGGFWPS